MVVGAQQMFERSTALEIKYELKQAFANFGIPLAKIGVVCTDGGSNVVSACKELFGTNKHIVCACHILDNVVKESLSSEPILCKLLTNLKRLVQFFKQSYVAANFLRKLQKDDGVDKPLMVIQSVLTRWNSVLLAINRFVHLHSFIKSVLSKPLIARTNPPVLNDQDVHSLKEIIPLLENFQKYTTKFSTNSQPVSSTFILHVSFLTHYLKNLTLSEDFAKNLQKKLLEVLDARFKKARTAPLLAAAFMLDPR